MHTSTDFVLHGGNVNFANKQKLLFDQLSIAEKQCSKERQGGEHPDVSEMDTDIIESNKSFQPARVGLKRKRETRRFRGKESIFKRPEGPAPKSSFRSIPDHHKNPHKWIKYSLEDVTNEDMTERSNAQAALSFLKELKARKTKEQTETTLERMDTDEQEQAKLTFKSRKMKAFSSQIQFKKPVDDANLSENSTPAVVVDTDQKPVFRSSKVIMPEYVVGQKQKKKGKKEKHSVNVDHTKQLKLDHLEQLDEEDV